MMQQQQQQQQQQQFPAPQPTSAQQLLKHQHPRKKRHYLQSQRAQQQVEPQNSQQLPVLQTLALQQQPVPPWHGNMDSSQHCSLGSTCPSNCPMKLALCF
jgi:hypothetical protein